MDDVFARLGLKAAGNQQPANAGANQSNTSPSWWQRLFSSKKAPEPEPEIAPRKPYIPPPPFAGKANPTFRTAEEAAIAAARAMNQRSQREHVEYGSRVFKLGDHMYSYTGPFTQNNVKSVNMDDPNSYNDPEAKDRINADLRHPTVPLGMTNVAEVHSHVSSPGRDPNRLSFGDADRVYLQHIPSYVIRPDNRIMMYDPATGRTTFVGEKHVQKRPR